MNDVPINIQIRIELLKKGISLSDIARRLGYHQTYVSMIVTGRKYNKEIATYINRLIGKKLLPEERPTPDRRFKPYRKPRKRKKPVLP